MGKKLKRDKGVAGLTLFLSLVTLLFVIGLLVMVFSLTGGELQGAVWDLTSVTVTNESGLTLNSTTNDTVASASNNVYSNGFVLTNVTAVFNDTAVAVPLANVSFDSTGLVYLTNPSLEADTLYGTSVNVSYTFNYNATNQEANVIGNTTGSLASAVDWFDIFIVIGAMVVLILLTVIIITAIRGSGLIAGGDGNSSSGAGGNVGSA